MSERPAWVLAGTGTSSGDDTVEAVAELPAILGHNMRRLRTRQGHSLDRLAKLSGVSRAMLGQIETVMGQVDTSIQQVSNLDMRVADQSRETLRQMWVEMENLNVAATEQSHHITQVSEQIHKQVLDGIVSLQFDDLVRQLLEQVQKRSEFLEHYLNGLYATQQDKEERQALLRFQKRIDNIAEAMRQSQAEFRGLDQKSITQTNVNVGSVDLF